MIKKRLEMLMSNSGLTLFLLRLPKRTLTYLLNIAATKYYSFFLGGIGGGVKIEFGVHIENPRNVFIEDKVTILKGTLITTDTGKGVLSLGHGVHIGNGCHIDHSGDLTFRSECTLSSEVTIYSHTHGLDPKSSPVAVNKVIGKNVWLGMRVVVLEGCVNIAEDVVVGAGSVVVKSIEVSKSIYAGVPAKKIR